MARWADGTADRLRAAALEQFAVDGFEAVTAARIAESVGLTERTFFRHFPDKREVLFTGSERLQAAFVDAVSAAPPDVPPFGAVEAGLRAATDLFPDRMRDDSRIRQGLIATTETLRERETHKLATLADAVRDALHGRDVPEPTATLAARSGITVFELAFERWVAPGETRSLTAVAAELAAGVRALAGA